MIVACLTVAAIMVLPVAAVVDRYLHGRRHQARPDHLLGCERLIERVVEDDKHREIHARSGCASLDWCDVHDGPRESGGWRYAAPYLTTEAVRELDAARPMSTIMPGDPERRRG